MPDVDANLPAWLRVFNEPVVAAPLNALAAAGAGQQHGRGWLEIAWAGGGCRPSQPSLHGHQCQRQPRKVAQWLVQAGFLLLTHQHLPASGSSQPPRETQREKKPATSGLDHRELHACLLIGLATRRRKSHQPKGEQRQRCRLRYPGVDHGACFGEEGSAVGTAQAVPLVI